MENKWEVEQKFHVDDLPGLESALSAQGFTMCGEERHRDVYMRHPSRNFRETDEAFRVRALGDEACVTYKGPRLQGSVKTRPEIELSIRSDEVDAWLDMLSRLGFPSVPEVKKTRRIFHSASAPGVLVVIDDVEQLGTFAEVELIIEDAAALSDAGRRIEALGKALGLTRPEKRSYLGQLLSKLGIE